MSNRKGRRSSAPNVQRMAEWDRFNLLQRTDEDTIAKMKYARGKAAAKRRKLSIDEQLALPKPVKP